MSTLCEVALGFAIGTLIAQSKKRNGLARGRHLPDLRGSKDLPIQPLKRCTSDICKLPFAPSVLPRIGRPSQTGRNWFGGNAPSINECAHAPGSRHELRPGPPFGTELRGLMCDFTVSGATARLAVQAKCVVETQRLKAFRARNTIDTVPEFEARWRQEEADDLQYIRQVLAVVRTSK